MNISISRSIAPYLQIFKENHLKHVRFNLRSEENLTKQMRRLGRLNLLGWKVQKTVIIKGEITGHPIEAVIDLEKEHIKEKYS